MIKQKLLSIIIVTFNAEKYIEKTLKSIVGQKESDIELIIIDGESKDKTMEICDRYKESIDIILSESDSGIYDAMNKGIAISSAKYVYFIGAGDTMLPDVLSQIKKELQSNIEIIYGKCYFDSDKNIYGEEMSLRKLMFKNICHQGMFIQKKLFNQVGYYDLKYIALADWWWNIIVFYNKSITKKFVPIVIASYAGGGFSEVNKDTEFKKFRKDFVLRHYGVITYLILKIYIGLKYLKKFFKT